MSAVSLFAKCSKTMDEWAPKIRQFRGSGMVSGFGTIWGNILGTKLNIYAKPFRSLSAAVADLPIAAVTGQRSRYFSEVAAEMHGMFKALPSAWKAAARTARSVREIDDIQGGFGGAAGKVINTPFKILGWSDQLMYNQAFHSEMYRMARRASIKTGRSFKEIMDEQATFMPKLGKIGEEINALDAAKRAGKENAGDLAKKRALTAERDAIYKKSFVKDSAFMAEKTIFTAREEEWLDSIITSMEGWGGIGGGIAHTVLPFKRTPAYVVRESIRGTPVGALEGLSRASNALRKEGANTLAIQGRLSDDMGQALAGTAMMYAMIQMAVNGDLKANPYKERAAAERVTEEAAGILPNTVQLGDWSIPVSRLEPFGSYLLNAARVADLRQGENPPEGMVEDLVAATQNLVLLSAKETFLDPFAEFAEALQDDTTLARYMQNLGGSFVPRAISQFDQTIRDTPKDEFGFTQGVKTKIPGVGEAKLGLFGKERETQAYLPSLMMGRVGKATDPLAQEMVRVGAMHLPPTGLDKNFVGQLTRRKIGYTDSEDRTLRMAKGRVQEKMVQQVVESPLYQRLPQGPQGDAARKTLLDRAFQQASNALNQRAKALKLAKVPITTQALFGK